MAVEQGERKVHLCPHVGQVSILRVTKGMRMEGRKWVCWMGSLGGKALSVVYATPTEDPSSVLTPTEGSRLCITSAPGLPVPSSGHLHSQV